jgi:hypothetical protein
MGLEVKSPENIEGNIALEKERAREKLRPLIDLVNIRYRSPDSTISGKENLIKSFEAHNSEVLDAAIELGMKEGLGHEALTALEIAAILHDLAKGDPAPENSREIKNFVLVNHHEMAAAEVEEILRVRHPEILGLTPEGQEQSPEAERIINSVKNAIICHMGPSPGFMDQTLREANKELSEKGLLQIAHPEPNDNVSKILLAADMRSLAGPGGIQKILNLRAASFLADDERLCAKYREHGRELSVPEAALISAIDSALDAVDMVSKTCGKKGVKWIHAAFDAAKQTEFIYRRGEEETKVTYDQIRERMLWDLLPAGKTGVTGDYWNAFTVLFSAEDPEEWERRGIEYTKERYRKKGSVIEKYEEKYSPDRYNYSQLTEEAKRRIARLDEIIDEINQLYAQNNFTREEILTLFNEARDLIYK